MDIVPLNVNEGQLRYGVGETYPIKYTKHLFLRGRDDRPHKSG